MIRLLASTVVKLIANAVALLVGNFVLEDMAVSGAAFLLAVLIFTGIEVLVEPFFRQLADRNARALAGGTALFATFVGLVITAAVSDGLSITGASTWLFATVLVWAVALGVQLLLPLLIFKKALANRRA